MILGKDPENVIETPHSKYPVKVAGFPKTYDKLIDDLRSFLKSPLQEEWLKDDALFYFIYRTFGYKSIKSELDISEVYKIKQTAIKEWIKLTNIQSEYFELLGVDAGQGNISECLEIKAPKKENDLYKAMLFYIKEYEDKNNKTPTDIELWNILKTANMGQWCIEFSNDELVTSAVNNTNFQSFKKRYKRYYPTSS